MSNRTEQPAATAAAVNVRIPVNLRTLTQQQTEATLHAATVSDAITVLDSRFPGIKKRLMDAQGALRRFVLITVNDQSLDPDEALATHLCAGDEISIIPAIAGG